MKLRHAVMSSLLSAMFLCVMSPSLLSDDWPQWRGAYRDGSWRETGIVEAIPEAGLAVKWRARVLNGRSGPAIAEGRVFITDHDCKSQPEVERVLCLDEKTGKQLWRYEYPCI